MNVYDFDGTIYDGDCTVDFYFWCMKRYPYIIKFLPEMFFAGLEYLFRIRSKECFKEKFYHFLTLIPEIDVEVRKFWDSHECKLQNWYLRRKSFDDLIISASPEFLISEISERLNVNYVASRVNKKTGELLSPNCKGHQKIIELEQKYGFIPHIDEFYSDSDSDIPLAEIANRAFKVKKRLIYKWLIEQ